MTHILTRHCDFPRAARSFTIWRLMKLAIPLLLLAILNPMSNTASAENTSGASAAFTTNDPITNDALKLIDEGNFSQAQSLLASDDGHADPEVAKAREELKDVIRRIKVEYASDADALLAKLRKSIPDVTKDDLGRWTCIGQAQCRVIDGQTKYFNREPANIFRFCDEAKERRSKAGNAPNVDPRWKLTDHLKAVVEAGEESDSPEVTPIKHRMTFTLTIPENAAGVKKDSLVRVWLPFPQEYRQQKDVKLISTSPQHASIAPNATDTNDTISGAPQRTIYFEQRVSDFTKPMVFKEVFEFNSFAYYPKLEEAKAQPVVPEWTETYLTERAPHIRFTPQLREQVASIVGTETNPLIKVRKIFHWIDANVRYHAEDEYGTIASFSEKCFKLKRGDCGIQAILFITMCRAAGVPARWQSGWESKPIGYTMHDWAEFYVAPWGWLPADVSYGVQKSDDPRIRDFFIGHQDSYRMIVSLDYGRELVPPKPSLRSEPADFQRGEVELDGKNLYFDQWDYEMKIERNPGPNF
jgi:transglutaminase-like putative cysteine protease